MAPPARPHSFPPPFPSSARPPLPPRHSHPQPAPYIPPFRAKRLATVSSPRDTQLQRWKHLKKSINGVINRLNFTNLSSCSLQLLRLNLVRTRGLFCKAVLRAQIASPNLSPVFASLVAVIGSRLPFLVNLLLRRLVAQLRTAYGKQDRTSCFATARFLANLYKQHVVKELLLLEFLYTCVLEPSDGSAELAVVTLRECAGTLAQESPTALENIIAKLREMLHDGHLGRRAQVTIDNLMVLRRNKFRDLPSKDPRLDMLEERDIFTHELTLEEDLGDLEPECDTFQFDPQYEENETTYMEISKEILGAALEPPPQAPADKLLQMQSDRTPRILSQSADNAPPKGNIEPVPMKTTDMTEAELVQFRRTVYLILSSTLSHEDSAHGILKFMRDKKGWEDKLCQMIIECCGQEKTFLRSYGRLAQRLCCHDRVYLDQFEDLFATHYARIHLFDTRKIQNVANLFAFLLATDALAWNVLEVVRIVEKETTSSSRIFLKILFQEMYKTSGESRTKRLFKQHEQAGHMKGLFPTDSSQNALFSINFFTTIQLGFLTEDLRDKLKSLPNETVEVASDGDDKFSSSPSALSSSLSSSSMSESSEGEDADGSKLNDNDSRGSKRPQEQTSPVQSERPVKRIRVSVDSDRREELDRSRWAYNRRNITYDEIERNHRAYINSSPGPPAFRLPQGSKEESEPSYRSKRNRNRYKKYEQDRRRREHYRSSRHVSREYRERDLSHDDAPARGSPGDRGTRHLSDVEEYKRSRRVEERDAFERYDDAEPHVADRRNRRREREYPSDHSLDSRDQQRRKYRRRHDYCSDSGSPRHSPERRRRRSNPRRHRYSKRRDDSSDYSNSPSRSRSPRPHRLR